MANDTERIVSNSARARKERGYASLVILLEGANRNQCTEELCDGPLGQSSSCLDKDVRNWPTHGLMSVLID